MNQSIVDRHLLFLQKALSYSITTNDNHNEAYRSRKWKTIKQ